MFKQMELHAPDERRRVHLRRRRQIDRCFVLSVAFRLPGPAS